MLTLTQRVTSEGQHQNSSTVSEEEDETTTSSPFFLETYVRKSRYVPNMKHANAKQCKSEFEEFGSVENE